MKKFYSKVAFNLASNNCLDPENFTNGVVKIHEKDGIKYYKKVEKHKGGHHTAFYAGAFNSKEQAIAAAKKILYSTIVYYSRRSLSVGINLATDITDESAFNQVAERTESNDKFMYTVYGNSDNFQIIETELDIITFDKYKSHIRITASIRADNEFTCPKFWEENIKYEGIAAETLRRVSLAHSSSKYEIKIPYLCSAIELMAGNGKTPKDSKIIKFFDNCIDSLNSSVDINSDDKNRVIGYLEDGKKLGSKQKCLNLIKDNIPFIETRTGDKIESKKIFNAAYNYRSAIMHGNPLNNETIQENFGYYQELSALVLDLLQAILLASSAGVEPATVP